MDVPVAAVGAFLGAITPPLGLGTIDLEDGGAVTGFLVRKPTRSRVARDISEFGGWRALAVGSDWYANRARPSPDFAS